MVQPQRYRVPMGYFEAVRWFTKRLSKKYKGFKMGTIVDRPGVIAAFGRAPIDGLRWIGINVSKYDGHVMVFVISSKK